jgi:hypothetical protein
MIKQFTSVSMVSAVILASTFNVMAGWRDYLPKDAGGLLWQPETQSLASQLSQSEVAAGLKEALAQGVETAIKSLGRTDGYLGNDLVRIPMPDYLDTLVQGVRAVGGDAYVDEFITTMNRAAEKAVPEAAEIFANAIRQMSIDDAKQILAGPDDAATQYFQRVAGPELVERFRPIVVYATESVGVTSAYKGMVGQAGPMLSMLGQPDAADLDGYVTNKAVDGLFTVIAQQEKQIRENPVARTTDLLKKVFGSVN